MSAIKPDVILAENDFAYLSAITAVNFKPHPFMIGVKHVVYASDHNGGGLTEDVMRKIPCAQRDCTASYDEHTNDKVACVYLKRDVQVKELQAWLESLIADGTCPESKCDGFVFIETGFRIIRVSPIK